MNHRNGWKMLSKCGSYLVVFMSLSVSLISAILLNELNGIDVPFTALDSVHSNRKGKCEYLPFFTFVFVSSIRFSILVCSQIVKNFVVAAKQFMSVEIT